MSLFRVALPISPGPTYARTHIALSFTSEEENGTTSPSHKGSPARELPYSLALANERTPCSRVRLYIYPRPAGGRPRNFSYLEWKEGECLWIFVIFGHTGAIRHGLNAFTAADQRARTRERWRLLVVVVVCLIVTRARVWCALLYTEVEGWLSRKRRRGNPWGTAWKGCLRSWGVEGYFFLFFRKRFVMVGALVKKGNRNVGPSALDGDFLCRKSYLFQRRWIIGVGITFK